MDLFMQWITAQPVDVQWMHCASRAPHTEHTYHSQVGFLTYRHTCGGTPLFNTEEDTAHAEGLARTAA